MIKAPPILTRLTSWRRGPALVGLVALALLHVSAAIHQFEHSADHGDEHHVSVCETCAIYGQLEDTAVDMPPAHETFGAPDNAVATLQTVADIASAAGTHRSRAPPSS